MIPFNGMGYFSADNVYTVDQAREYMRKTFMFRDYKGKVRHYKHLPKKVIVEKFVDDSQMELAI